jgi:integrator complex subunit 7
MLLRLATEFRTADVAMRVRIIKTLLNSATGPGALAGARITEPDQLLRRVKVVYDTGNKRDRALALRMFGCFADIAKDSVHVRSLILSSLSASSALEVTTFLHLSHSVAQRMICPKRTSYLIG